MARQTLLAEALALPVDARAELVRELLESLDAEPTGDVDALWAAEISRRVDLVRQGKAELIPAEQVVENLRARLEQIRGNTSS